MNKLASIHSHNCQQTFPPIRPLGSGLWPSSSLAGYTLIETLVAFFVLVSVVVPLISMLFGSFRNARSEEKLVACWILEQEAAIVKYSSAGFSSVKRRHVAGKDWIIRSEASGNGLQKHVVRVGRGERVVVEGLFHVLLDSQ